MAERIRGFIEQVKKADPEKGSLFALARYETPGGMVPGVISAWGAGTFETGDFFEATGQWNSSTNRLNGRKEDIFRARTMQAALPRSPESAKAWLAKIFNARDHGVTPETVEAFVAKGGPGIIEKCDADPSLILGISEDPAKFRPRLLETWGRRVSGRLAVRLMEKAGIDEKAISAVVDALRDSAFEVLRTDPYKAARVKEFGFANADLLGAALNIGKEDQRRLTAALLDCIETRRQEGHTYVPIGEVAASLSETYDIQPATVNNFVVQNAKRSDLPFVLALRDGRPVVMNRDLYLAEAVIAKKTVELLRRPAFVSPERAEQIVDQILKEKKRPLDAIQRAAVIMAVQEPFAIITGGPGTGKSFVTEVVVAACAAAGQRKISLAAPTGKAAQRLLQASGRDASTVHLLLEATGNENDSQAAFRRNRDNPLPSGTFVVIDEASMLDARTMKALMEAMPSDGKLLLVGDRNQLPSVDAGAVLADLLSGATADGLVVPRTELINVYRQDRTSRIATGAAEIKEGLIPPMTNRDEGGLTLFEHASSEVPERIKWIVAEVLVGQRRLRVEDFVVLSPQSTGACGTNRLNIMLSRLLNPNGAAIPGVTASAPDRGSNDPVPVPRVGDRVMLSENDKERGVANGDVGTIIEAFEKPSGKIRHPFFKVRFDNGKVLEYRASAWRNFLLAYAITIHKSQGSQYSAVIMPTVMEHERMLDRTIFYTGWTRAQESLFVVGQREAVEMAVANTDKARRSTRLGEFIGHFAKEAGLKPRQQLPPPPAAVPASPARPATPLSLSPSRHAQPAKPLPGRPTLGFTLSPSAKASKSSASPSPQQTAPSRPGAPRLGPRPGRPSLGKADDASPGLPRP